MIARRNACSKQNKQRAWRLGRPVYSSHGSRDAEFHRREKENNVASFVPVAAPSSS